MVVRGPKLLPWKRYVLRSHQRWEKEYLPWLAPGTVFSESSLLFPDNQSRTYYQSPVGQQVDRNLDETKVE